MDNKLIYTGIAVAATAVAFHFRSLKKIHDQAFNAGWEGAMGWVKDNHEKLGRCPHFESK